MAEADFRIKFFRIIARRNHQLIMLTFSFLYTICEFSAPATDEVVILSGPNSRINIPSSEIIDLSGENINRNQIQRRRNRRNCNVCGMF